jgi:hypothetical protein
MEAYREVMLAPDTMSLLLDERRRVRFHQPSRVREAEEVRALLDQERLKMDQPLPEPPAWLVNEVGRDLAEILEAARAAGGRVIRPYPIFRYEHSWRAKPTSRITPSWFSLPRRSPIYFLREA